MEPQCYANSGIGKSCTLPLGHEEDHDSELCGAMNPGNGSRCTLNPSHWPKTAHENASYRWPTPSTRPCGAPGPDGLRCTMERGHHPEYQHASAGGRMIWATMDMASSAPTIKGSVADEVDHPAHYGGADNPYEAIKVIDAWGLGFCLGNVVKYIARAGKKDAALVALKKARWYLDHEIQHLEASDGGK